MWQYAEMLQFGEGGNMHEYYNLLNVAICRNITICRMWQSAEILQFAECGNMHEYYNLLNVAICKNITIC